MSLTTEQRKALRDCPECGHMVWPPTPHEFGHNIGLRICTGGDCACGMDLHHVNTTYENVEALLSETVAAMRAELDAAEAEVKQLRESIEELADRLERDSSAGARARWDSAYSAAYGDGYQDGASLGAEGLRHLLDGGAS